jgi:hypothetical protein
MWAGSNKAKQGGAGGTSQEHSVVFEAYGILVAEEMERGNLPTPKTSREPI